MRLEGQDFLLVFTGYSGHPLGVVRMTIWMISLTGFFRFALLNVRMTI